jgi:hypothetical protein
VSGGVVVGHRPVEPASHRCGQDGSVGLITGGGRDAVEVAQAGLEEEIFGKRILVTDRDD